MTSFHSPIRPTTTNPTMKSVCRRPIRNNVVTDSTEIVAMPLGFGDVAPVPVGFHPFANRPSRSPGLSGNG